jgi:hypothetical protein
MEWNEGAALPPTPDTPTNPTPPTNQDWERLYLLTKARWLIKEGPLVEQAVCEQGLHLAEDAPAFVQRRLKKKAMRVSIFGFQRRDGGFASFLTGFGVGGLDGWVGEVGVGMSCM